MNAAFAEITPLRRKLRLEDFLLLNDAGVFAEHAKTELIDGEIYYMNSQHRPHSYAKNRLARLLDAGLASAAPHLTALVEVSVAMPPDSVPEPDIVVTSEPRGNGPVPLSSVALCVEVADSSVDHDLRTKVAMYSRHGVPEYWVVDLNECRVVRFSNPQSSGYEQHDEIRFGNELASATIAGLLISTDSLT